MFFYVFPLFMGFSYFLLKIRPVNNKIEFRLLNAALLKMLH